MEEINRKRTRKNGVRIKIHQIWDAMIQRCTNKNTTGYKYYGARGITVCDRWRDFQLFYADMGEPPEGMSIDRIDNDGDYSPENCRWATKTEQARNTRRNHRISYNGRTQTLEEWAIETNQKANTILTRIRRDWPIGEALGFELHQNKTTLSKEEKESRKRNCIKCGKAFTPRAQQINIGKGKYCSVKCSLNNALKVRWTRTDTHSQALN